MVIVAAVVVVVVVDAPSCMTCTAPISIHVIGGESGTYMCVCLVTGASGSAVGGRGLHTYIHTYIHSR